MLSRLSITILKHIIFERMHRYFIRTPRLVKWLFPQYTWEMPSDHKCVYLTFDDGPHPTITPWVLSELEKWNAKATFFCIGKNVHQYSEVYNAILKKGHTTGNHTYNHLNGWKVAADEYISDIKKTASLVRSSLFRPPYGRIRNQHLKPIKELLGDDAQVIMWDVLSADFDKRTNKQQCLKNVMRNVRDGSIIVFHDSDKAYDNLAYALPLVLQELTAAGYKFHSLENKAQNRL